MLILGGANRDAGLRSMPIRHLFCDPSKNEAGHTGEPFPDPVVVTSFEVLKEEVRCRSTVYQSTGGETVEPVYGVRLREDGHCNLTIYSGNEAGTLEISLELSPEWAEQLSRLLAASRGVTGTAHSEEARRE
jgi:hypothetical protein